MADGSIYTFTESRIRSISDGSGEIKNNVIKRCVISVGFKRAPISLHRLYDFIDRYRVLQRLCLWI